MTRKLALFCAVALALLISTAPRRAAADSATEAQLQYELGAELYKQGRYTEAIDRFIASQRLVPNPNVVLNVVQTFSFLQRYEEAYNWNETFIELAKNDSQREEGKKTRGELAKKVAVLDVTTTPVPADLFIDRVELGSVGRSPRRVAVKPGQRQIIARADKHDEALANVNAKLGEAVPVTLALKPALGLLRVTSTPPGATVKDEATGAELGKTPLDLKLPVGEQRLEILLSGWVRQNKSVTVSRTKPLSLDVVLQRAASSVAVLSVRGNVDGATVMLDGRSIGLAPLSLDSLQPGAANLSVVAPGREAWGQRVMFERGAATRVEYDLADPKDKTWPGWRWLGYGTGGALLAAGAVVGLSALSARSDFDSQPSSDALSRVESRNRTADILMGAGVLVLGGTLTWDILRAPDPKSRGSVTIDR